ncbi:hypothetical protein D9C73_018458 [Collichthys lucidus]|uniref:E3 ubiquitin-protein ligase Arkadia N-terminal domain-containing protein n=1 Tax=Collichthys lucidus TaxID=240159 RepID=A0A4U5V9V3_COLLU|nr:hypothetical protein D9C73_018458 [Collichthys lucidus]
MADSEKAEEFVDAECHLECLDEAQSATTSFQGEQELKTETTTSTSSPPREKEGDSPLNTEGEQSLLSMPCLMKELRRDSPESQHASTGSDKPTSRHVYESDSSNPCMLSPSSSGHLADSDTLSSGDEGAAPRVGGGGGEEECGMEASNDPGQAAGKQTSATGGRKSRRSRSESEMPPNAMAAKKNRCQPATVAAGGQEKQTNGKLAKVKGHRSQKHKERMRLLRQKREAAARKKYNLLQDSSTSDSELTCDSSTSSSEDEDDDTSGGSKTIKTDISAGFRRASERSRVGAQIHGLLDSSTWDRNGIGSVLEEAMTRFAVMQRQTEERFRIWMEKLAHLDSDNDSSKRSSDALEGQQHPSQGGRPSPPSSYLPSSESAETMAAYMLARESNSLTPNPINNNILPEVVTQNGNLDGPPVVGHYDISDTDSNQESMSVETVRPTVIKHELKTHRGQDMATHSGCIRALSSISGHVEAELSHKESSQRNKGQINIASSDSEVEIVGVQEKARCAHPCGGVIKSLSSWKENSVEQLNSTNQPQLWTTVSPQPNWVSPPEVVDLTLDEDAGHKYLL